MYVANNQWHKGYYINTCRPTMCQGLKASWTVLHKEITESGSGDNSNSRSYKAPTPQTYQHSSFYRLYALPVAEPTVVKALKAKLNQGYSLTQR